MDLSACVLLKHTVFVLKGVKLVNEILNTAFCMGHIKRFDYGFSEVLDDINSASDFGEINSYCVHNSYFFESV